MYNAKGYKRACRSRVPILLKKKEQVENVVKQKEAKTPGNMVRSPRDSRRKTWGDTNHR